MAIKVGGTEVVSNARELKNIATIDSGTVTAFNSALNTDPTKGTLTKTFTQNETAEITLSSNVTVGPVVSATKEVPQTGVSTKGNWDVNSTASNYDFHNTAANVTLTPSNTFSITSGAYTSRSLDVPNAATGSDGGFFFKPDGTKLYVLEGTSNGSVREYNLSTAFDITTATHSQVATLSQYTKSLHFSPDGTKLFTQYTYYSTRQIRQYALSTAWDISTIGGSAATTLDINGATSNAPGGFTFNGAGTRIYITRYDNDTIHQYNLSTAFDLTSATLTSNATLASTNNVSDTSPFISSDGTKLLIADHGAYSILQYNLSTAYDITTISSLVGSFSVQAETTNYVRQMYLIESSNLLLVYRPSTNPFFHEYNVGAAALALGSGSFASSDVGKRITGNGGDVVLTSTGGAFSTTGGSAFTDSSTIAAGSWSMFGLKSAGDASGITMAGLTRGYDIANASSIQTYTGASSYMSYPHGLLIKPDGTSFYYVDPDNNRDKVYQFNMSTAYDLSTASFFNDKTVGSQDTLPKDVHFKPDGTKMYVLGNDLDRVFQYSLSTAWAVNTASYDNTYVGVNHSDSQSIFFKTDGLMIYSYGDGNIKQMSIATAWDLSSSIGSPSTLNIGATNGDGDGSIHFSPDGTKLFYGRRNSQQIYMWNLSTPWDITSSTYSNVFFDVSNDITTLLGLHITDDGQFMYALDHTHKNINRYTIGSFVQPTAQYHVGVTNTSGRIDSSAFTDINGMTAAQVSGTGTVNYAVSTDGRTTWNVNKGTDGVRPIVRNNSGTWQYNNDGGTTTGYSIANASYDSVNFSVASQDTNPRDLTFNADGTKMFVVSANTSAAYQYSLSTAFDLSTASYDSVSFSVNSQDGSPYGIHFNTNGTKMFMLGDANNTVYQYTLSTGFDLSTASYSNVSFSVNSQDSAPYGLSFNNDGTKMYIAGGNNDRIYQYSLSTGFDLSTASYASVSLHVTSQDTVPFGLAFNSNGTKMYLLGLTNDTVFQYSLSTGFDLSTASYDSVSFSVTSQDAIPNGIRFNNDGTKMYIIGASGDKVYQYSTGTSAYGTSTTWVNGTVNDELYTLQQALTAQAFNRMDKTQLDAIPDANHFATGTSLDLMIALRMNTAASTLPTSDGVTLNYDAAALNEGAVLGTDYDFFHPAANKVQIKSLAAQNLKVRVV